jgi:hypothetical protein
VPRLTSSSLLPPGPTFLRTQRAIVIGLRSSPHPPRSPAHPIKYTNKPPTMDVSSNRLFRFTKPEWLNNAAVRNAGVYTSGALVRTAPNIPTISPSPNPHPLTPLFSFLSSSVRSRLLLPRRRSILLAQRPQRLRRAHQIRRLDPRHLLRAGHAGHQLD